MEQRQVAVHSRSQGIRGGVPFSVAKEKVYGGKDLPKGQVSER